MKRCIRLIAIIVGTVAVLSSCASTYKPSTKYKPKWRCSVDEQDRGVVMVKIEENKSDACVLASK
ncbi:MAG: hypothetical protein MJZ27_07295 [Bacteroidales bacterium]|nr:hypothetical protein [Bacteroidales bacterium]